MFKIKLFNIRCYTQSEFIFKEGKISLIKGKSGSGKSTILDAITWCLYGKVKGIKNKNVEKEKYYVEVIFESFSILRQRNPTIFKYTINTPGGPCIFENEAAQTAIIQRFGSEDLWYSCSYIEQKKLCPLLYGSNADRMSSLCNLSFWLDNPEAYLDKIDERIKLLQTEYDILEKSYTNSSQILNAEIIKRPIPTERMNTLISKWGVRNELSDHIAKILIELETLQKQINDNNILKGTVNTFKYQLQRCEQDLATSLELIIPEDIIKSHQDTLDSLNESIYTTSQQIKNVDESSVAVARSMDKLRITESERSTVTSRIATLKDNLEKMSNEYHVLSIKCGDIMKKLSELQVTPEDVNPDDYYKFKDIEDKIMTSMILSKKLNVAYGPDGVDKLKKELTDRASGLGIILSSLAIKNQIINLERELSILGSPVKVTDDDIATLTKVHQDMLQRREVLQCPHCQKSVKYISGKLQAEDASVVSESELSSCRMNLERAKTSMVIYYRYEAMNNQITALKNVLISQGVVQFLSTPESQIKEELEMIKEKQKLIMSITFIEKPKYESEVCKLVGEYRGSYRKSSELLLSITRVKEDIFKLEQHLEDIAIVMSNLKTNILTTEGLPELRQSFVNKLSADRIKVKDITTIIEGSKNATLAVSNLSKLKDGLTLQIKTIESSIIEGLESTYDHLRCKYIDLQMLKGDLDYNNAIIEKHIDLQKRYQELTGRCEYLIAANRLRKKAFDLECIQLQTTVDNINNTLNSILREIFDTPIRVLLKLSKKNKSNDRIIPSVNFNVLYKGLEYDNISGLSGGEQSRISVALTLALSSVNGSPLLFLDEVLASVDLTIREMCINAMRAPIFRSKTILCVEHEGVDGLYDDVSMVSS